VVFSFGPGLGQVLVILRKTGVNGKEEGGIIIS
jgi:hypothetical protein